MDIEVRLLDVPLYPRKRTWIGTIVILLCARSGHHTVQSNPRCNFVTVTGIPT